MIVVQRKTYTLLMSHDPCEIFNYYGKKEIHGLKYDECMLYNNTNDNAYIAGLSNYVPDKKKYIYGDNYFVFINLSRCNNVVETVRLIFHELMHRAFELHNWEVEFEEEIITWADEETTEVFNIVQANINLC
jgi:hypothetical protein